MSAWLSAGMQSPDFSKVNTHMNCGGIPEIKASSCNWRKPTDWLTQCLVSTVLCPIVSRCVPEQLVATECSPTNLELHSTMCQIRCYLSLFQAKDVTQESPGLNLLMEALKFSDIDSISRPIIPTHLLSLILYAQLILSSQVKLSPAHVLFQWVLWWSAMLAYNKASSS